MSKLKAFVRYDATGRIIPGSLILQRSKPKVGDWQEIDAYECCNPTTSTSTTSIPYPLYVCAQNGSNTVTLSNTIVDEYPYYSSTIVTDIIYYYNGAWHYTTPQSAYDSSPTTSLDPTTAVWPEGVTVTSGPCTYTIGQYTLGGVVAYILQEGDPGYDSNVQHGLVVNISYDGSGRIPTPNGWGCYGTNLPGVTGTNFGTGPQNTLDILSSCTDPDIAAYICTHLNDYGYNDEGYTDWYLPSNGELTKIWENISLSNLYFAGSEYIWSSTEFGSIEAYALANDGTFTFLTKDTPNNVFIWATRSF